MQQLTLNLVNYNSLDISPSGLLLQQQRMPLKEKIEWSKEKIKEWIEYWGSDHVYISFSGGKDSTVLLHLVREMYPDVKAVFVDTGVEYPEIVEFVKQFENVDWLEPKKSFRDVVIDHGYPIVSKEYANKIETIRKFSDDPKVINHYKLGIRNGENTRFGLPKKWWYLLNVDFKISSYCCFCLKKSPIFKYEGKNKVVPILAMRAEESQKRVLMYFEHGCNSYDKKRPSSNPLAIWTEQDILRYLKENNIPIAKCYGDIIEDRGYLSTAKEHRTGCMFCGYGLHLQEQPNKYQRMKVRYPELWEYAMKPIEEGGLGMRHVLEVYGVPYGEESCLKNQFHNSNYMSKEIG